MANLVSNSTALAFRGRLGPSGEGRLDRGLSRCVCLSFRFEPVQSSGRVTSATRKHARRRSKPLNIDLPTFFVSTSNHEQCYRQEPAYHEVDMLKAISAVEKKEYLSIQKTALAFSVPYPTLQVRMSGQTAI